MNEWWLINQENIDEIRKNLDTIIDLTTEDAVRSAKDALMFLDSSMHKSNVKPWDM